MSERKYYCICDSNCKFETMTKEQILAAIAQAVETGSVGNCDTGFITKVKEQNNGLCVTFWVGTQAQYNALDSKAENCMYIISDDTTGTDLRKAFTAAVQAAEDAATAAAELAAAAKALEYQDLTNVMTLSWLVNGGGGLNLTGIRTENHFVRYIPALNVLTYNVSVYLKGKMAKDEVTYLAQYSAPARVRDGSQTPLQTIHRAAAVRDVEGRYVTLMAQDGSGNAVGSGISIRANEAIDTGDEECRIIFQGWHYVAPTE